MQVFPQAEQRLCYFHYSQIILRRIRKVPAAFELLRKKDRKAWKTTRCLLALPMIQLDKLKETADFILEKAPAAFKDLIKAFIKHYVRGAKVRIGKSRRFRRRAPM